MKSDTQATIIVIAAIVVSAPRWAVALLAAEGFALPADWLEWWVPVSAFLSLGMAIVEGLAFSFVFTAWRNMKKDDRKRNDGLLWMALASAAVFVAVLAPSIGANVRGVRLGAVLSSSFSLYTWASMVALSTIAIVVSVGFAQKENVKPATDTEAEKWRELAKAAERKALEAEAQANAANARFDAAGDMMRLLVSENKRDRILAARQQWPELPVTWLALVAGASPSYVSEVINGNE